MTPETFERLLALVIPQDSYRSPNVPTKRLGRPAYVLAFGARSRAEGTQTEAPDSSSADFTPRSSLMSASMVRSSTVEVAGAGECMMVGGMPGQLLPAATRRTSVRWSSIWMRRR